ncbi:DUF4886 domain-containing protein [Sphingobacterium chuzhouense]|uniref:DUF4886 domain-containing protein n=1 Tax=Sphingobacterium chuzhouense TaxID=1742264 RepID=UPI001CC1D629|nr:DUF4886 domain-containing protein [Sphingobacterium chuzhouense]
MKRIQLNNINIWLLLAIFLNISIFQSCKNDGNVYNLPDAKESEYLPTKKEGIIKILAIGNSFSEDAIENNLYDLAKEKGIEIIIGNLYIGGASLELHNSNVERNASSYSYRKITPDGKRTEYPGFSIQTVLKDEYWDYISFQQASDFSGMYETVEASLPQLFEYVNATKLNPDVKYIYHQTWAYAQNTNHAAFPNYDSDQLTMYGAIVSTAQKATELIPIDILIPTGTAIQNSRTSVVGDNFNVADGYHLDRVIGRYTAACTWFEAIFGESSVGMAYKPEGLSVFETSIAQNAAHMAIQKPNEITEMTDFQGGGGGPLESAVLLDFGNNAASESWNQINSFLPSGRINLKDSLGSFVGLGLTVTERFNGVNGDGPRETNTPFDMPETVSRYSYFGNSKAEFGGMIIEKSVFVINGLDKNITYNICFFGARGGVSDNRETKYMCKGNNEVVVRLNTSSNTSNIVCAENISPDESGNITVTVTAGENNSNGNGFYYLTAARLMSN